MKRIEILPPEQFTLTDHRRIKLDHFALTDKDDVAVAPALSPTGALPEVMARYSEVETTLNRRYPHLRCLLPHAEVVEDGAEFGEAFRLDTPIGNTVLPVRPSRPEWAEELELYARYREQLLFPAHDEQVTHLTDLHFEEGQWWSKIAAGRWSTGRCTMDSAGLVIEEKSDDQYTIANLLTSKLIRNYGSGCTLRKAMRRQLKVGNVLLPYSTGACQWNLGVGGSIITSDGRLVITRRNRGVHVNIGRIYGAGGGVIFDSDKACKLGLFGLVDDAMMTELTNEIGQGNYELVRVGFVRELPREGSPEFFYLLKFAGTVEELLQVMANNPHPERSEVDKDVYAFDPEDIIPMLENEDSTSIIGHKGMVILFYIASHLGIFR